jgi:hypothetical protein
MRRPAQFSRPLTPLEVGALLIGLALILAFCMSCTVLSLFAPAPAVPYPAPAQTFERSEP